jgi:hypothetical protein
MATAFCIPQHVNVLLSHTFYLLWRLVWVANCEFQVVEQQRAVYKVVAKQTERGIEFNDVVEMSLNKGLPAEWGIVWVTNNHDC